MKGCKCNQGYYQREHGLHNMPVRLKLLSTKEIEKPFICNICNELHTSYYIRKKDKYVRHYIKGKLVCNRCNIKIWRNKR